MKDNCVLEEILGMTLKSFRLFLGIAWLMDLSESSKNPLISSQRTMIIYILLAIGFSISYSLLIGLLPPITFERVFLSAIF